MDFIKRMLERYREQKGEKKSKNKSKKKITFASYRKKQLELLAIHRPKHRGVHKYFIEELREVARKTKNEQGNVQLS